jgi:uncharacterized membrane protein YphA (DoxX/SURF4 family)
MTSLGRCVLGIAAIWLGLVGLAWGEFATVWHPVQDYTPFRTPLAYLTAVALIACGLAIQWRRTAGPGLLVLTVFFTIFALLWTPRIVLLPHIVATWAGFAEQFAIAIAAFLTWRDLKEDAQAGHVATALRIIFGVCAILWAFNHFTNIPQTASMVPGWIPGGGGFWAWATGFGHLLAGLALLSGILAALASRLLAAMFAVFQLCIWLPGLLSAPRDHVIWSGNGVNLAAVAAALLLAEHLARRRAAPKEESVREVPAG